MDEQVYNDARDLLYAIWRTVDADFKASYKMTIWRIFEDRVRVAANQNGNIRRFADQLCRSLGASLGRNEDERGEAFKVLRSDNERALLKVLREETSYVVMLVRMEMQNLKELYNDN